MHLINFSHQFFQSLFSRNVILPTGNYRSQLLINRRKVKVGNVMRHLLTPVETLTQLQLLHYEVLLLLLLVQSNLQIQNVMNQLSIGLVLVHVLNLRPFELIGHIKHRLSLFLKLELLISGNQVANLFVFVVNDTFQLLHLSSQSGLCRTNHQSSLPGRLGKLLEFILIKGVFIFTIRGQEVARTWLSTRPLLSRDIILLQLLNPQLQLPPHTGIALLCTKNLLLQRTDIS